MIITYSTHAILEFFWGGGCVLENFFGGGAHPPAPPENPPLNLVTFDQDDLVRYNQCSLVIYLPSIVGLI
jgi:hypothetical protein